MAFMTSSLTMHHSSKKQPNAAFSCMTSENNKTSNKEPPLVIIPLYHYLHVRNIKLAPRISEVLAKMQHSGEIQRVIRKTLASI